MKTIIAGTRTFAKPMFLAHAIATCKFAKQITTVVSGGARGIDALGEAWAKEQNIPIERYPADWNAYGKKAGPMRNRVMAENADALIAIWDGESNGTRNMIEEASNRGLKLHVVTFKPWVPATQEAAK